MASTLTILGWILLGIVLLVAMFFAWWKWYFLRDPPRAIPQGEDLILSPADGRIIAIYTFPLNNQSLAIHNQSSESQKKTSIPNNDAKKNETKAAPVPSVTQALDDAVVIEKGLGTLTVWSHDVAQEGYIVSIFMSPMDVHYNRAPIQGTVLEQQHVPGKFFKADKFWLSLQNEHNIMLFEDSHQRRVKIVQIAGFVARRIVWFVNKGDKVEQGQKVGLINLGSQVTVIIPKNTELNIKVGERVTAGETILAVWKPTSKEKRGGET
ncbi:MAG: phosphatidylserine decarboxylase [Candidatus Woesearchaeota archaeon]